MESIAAIETRNLSKRYSGSDYLALNKLNLSVKPGEIYGFLGPNGAGKSTAIRLLLNFIQPTSGGGQVGGHDIVNDSVQIRRSLGYLAGEVALYPKMTGQQFLTYMSELQPAKEKHYQKELARRFQADLKPRISNLSKGNRQKIGIIQAFMHNPDVLILDEPTSGLDPLMQEEFFTLLRETKQRGATIFFSSHNLMEIQKICDRVGFIREGKLIAEQVVAEAAAVAARTFDIHFAQAAPLAELKKLKGVKLESASEHMATVHIKGQLSPLFQVLARHDVIQINQREVDLEAEFLRYYKRGIHVANR